MNAEQLIYKLYAANPKEGETIVDARERIAKEAFAELETERDKALAQVAVLVEALQEVRPYFEGEHHYDHPSNVVLRQALSNLPAAAKGEK